MNIRVSREECGHGCFSLLPRWRRRWNRTTLWSTRRTFRRRAPSAHKGSESLSLRNGVVTRRSSVRTGNWALSTGARGGLPVDLPDLSSHDLCAYARGTHTVTVGAQGGGWPYGTGGQRELDGTVFRSPSPRAETPRPNEWIDPPVDRRVTWPGGLEA